MVCIRRVLLSARFRRIHGTFKDSKIIRKLAGVYLDNVNFAISTKIVIFVRLKFSWLTLDVKIVFIWF